MTCLNPETFLFQWHSGALFNNRSLGFRVMKPTSSESEKSSIYKTVWHTLWKKHSKGRHFADFALFCNIKFLQKCSDQCSFTLPIENINVCRRNIKATLSWNRLNKSTNWKSPNWKFYFLEMLCFLALVIKSFRKQTPQNLLDILLLIKNKA